jgi:uncharacterized protein YecA (UPF0149 family)
MKEVESRAKAISNVTNLKTGFLGGAATAAAPQSGTKTPGRNDPCWCGSGKKFKKCHGK